MAAVWLASMLAWSPSAAPAAGLPLPTAASPAFESEAFEGRPVLFSGGANPRAVVYLFHGTGGSEAFARRREAQRAIQPLLAKGYAIVASRSGQREPARWDLTAGGAEGNADLDFMLRLHGDLVARGRIASATPVFAMGMSNGGGFASLFAVTASRKGLNVRGVADYMGPIPEAALTAPGALAGFPPIFVVQAMADGLVDPARVATVVEALKAAGVRTEFHLAKPQPLTTAALGELLDVDAPKAAELLAELKRAGVLGASGHVVGADAPLDRQAMASLERRLPPSAKGREVLNALIIAAAGHQMRSDYAEAQAAFFEAALSQPNRR